MYASSQVCVVNAPRPTVDFNNFNATASRQMSLDESGPSSSIRVQEFQLSSGGRGPSKISASASKLKRCRTI